MQRLNNRGQVVIPEEWKENFRMSRDSLYNLAEELRPCVYERFRVDGLKRYVNDDRFRVDGDKNMRLLAFAFTIVFVWTGPKGFNFG